MTMYYNGKTKQTPNSCKDSDNHDCIFSYGIVEKKIFVSSNIVIDMWWKKVK